MNTNRIRIVRLALATSMAVTLSIGATLAEGTGKTVVARVNGEPIRAEQVFEALAAVHTGMGNEPDRASKELDPSYLLDRLINVELLMQEAFGMGLGELPDIRSMLERNEEELLRDALIREQVEFPTVADADEVDRRYGRQMRLVRVLAMLVERDEDAERLRERLTGGEDLETIAEEMHAAGTGMRMLPDAFVPVGTLFDDMQTALDTLEPGARSGVFRVAGRGWGIVKLYEARLPEDEAERQEIRDTVLWEAQTSAVRRYADRLKEKYAKIDLDLLDSLDFEAAEPGFDALMTDGRTLVTIEVAEDITVSDLARHLESRFFHGTEQAAQKGRLNAAKRESLEAILDRRVVVGTARKLRLDETPSFRERMEKIERGVLFGAFVERAIDSTLEITEDDLREYFEARKADYATPAMWRLAALSFRQRDDAEDALRKLRNGADFRWLSTTVEGLLVPEDDGLGLAGDPVLDPELPGFLREALAGAGDGDYRFAAEPDGPYHVVRVVQWIAPVQSSFESVRAAIRSRVRGAKRQEALDEYAARLREVSEIEVLYEGDALTRLVMEDLRAGSND